MRQTPEVEATIAVAKEVSWMPVRKIPKNHLVVTGGYSSRKNAQIDAFESLLEKDYFLLLDFDETVDSFEPQPVRIPVPGVPRGYVPDVLVHYCPDPVAGVEPKSSLVDVKHTDDLAKHADKYAIKFEFARQFAEERGWEFKIVDQHQIRTPRLANLKFLRAYRNTTLVVEDIDCVLDCMPDFPCSHRSVLDRLAQTDDDRLRWLPVIWSMLLTGHLVTNMDEPFGSEVLISRGGARAWPR
ncbi:TnsA endonuclease N-terminal domain-containing protein [Leeia aquatica]|uniref:Heteromeric transposase endonuclease subunit TnsA n=1 Tax=Leeia aquatica TaxID=2725557 RepID=A0A847SDB3_9NEIS|nr:TnsA endonuclease N-terminal domain-containing protein [Leeia aquatica]NLR75309.1 heteromeric transposase endonuclease subunit TnsA [Leeia aquatica]